MSITRNGFQSSVNTVNPPGNVGDFASMNPRAVVPAGSGQLKAGSGVTVGYFAIANLSTGLAQGDVSGSGILGFVANELETVITDFLGSNRMVVQAGFPVTLYSHGDFWAVVAGAVTVGAAIYAVSATGEPTVTSSGNVATGFIAVTASPAATTAVTCTVAAGTGIMTTGAVTGSIEVGMNVTGTGVPAGLFVQSQLTGAAGAIGTYQLNYQGAAIASATFTFSQGRLVKISRTY